MGAPPKKRLRQSVHDQRWSLSVTSRSQRSFRLRILPVRLENNTVALKVASSGGRYPQTETMKAWISCVRSEIASRSKRVMAHCFLGKEKRQRGMPSYW